MCIINNKKPIMSLEKSIQKLTQVIQAAQLYSAQAIVGGLDDGGIAVHSTQCKTETRGRGQMCVCVSLGADGKVILNGPITTTPGPCKPRQVHDRDPDFVGPPKPLPPLPPEPVDGWECYWALKAMTDDTNNMEACCSLRPPEMTRICYYRNTPGGPIQKRPANLGG